MSRWQELVANLLTRLATETPGADGFRLKIDDKIWEVEQKVSKTVPIAPHETTARRLHGFQRELIETLSKQLKNDPANEILLEARSLLENPWLRVPEHQRPDLRSTRSAGVVVLFGEIERDVGNFINNQRSRKLLSKLDRLGCLSFRSAFASICRIRSRVTANCWPTSSSV